MKLPRILRINAKPPLPPIAALLVYVVAMGALVQVHILGEAAVLALLCQKTVQNFAETLTIQGGCYVGLSIAGDIATQLSYLLVWMIVPAVDIVGRVYNLRRRWQVCIAIVLAALVCLYFSGSDLVDLDLVQALPELFFYWLTVRLIRRGATFIAENEEQPEETGDEMPRAPSIFNLRD